LFAGHILDNIASIEVYSAGLGQDDIKRDGLRHDALERCLERICEAVARLGDQAEALMPGHPWSQIRGMGNRLRHAYDRIDFSIVWTVISDDLPALKADAAQALDRLADPGHTAADT
jgi:uncharacterized protein with HEPN domain